MTAPRLYGALLLAGGGTLLAMGLALTLLMIGSVIGPFRLFGSRSPSASRDVGLWLAPSSLAAPVAERGLRLDAWRSALSDTAKLEVGSSLAEFAERGVHVIALPDARALSESETQLLSGFLEAGGGVILTGGVGVQDAQGRAQGTRAMQRLLDVPRVALAARGDAPALAAARRGPLAAALAPGQRLRLDPSPALPGIDDAQAELRWSDGPDPNAALGASRRLARGRGRLVWLAAGPVEATHSGANAIGDDMRRLLAAAHAWAAREPFAEVLARPRGGADPELSPEAWQRLRELVDVGVVRMGPNRSLVEVTNRDAASLAGLMLRVYLNDSVIDVEVARTTLQQEEPELIFDRSEARVDVFLPELAAGASRAFTFDVEPRAAGPIPPHAAN